MCCDHMCLSGSSLCLKNVLAIFAMAVGELSGMYGCVNSTVYANCGPANAQVARCSRSVPVHVTPTMHGLLSGLLQEGGRWH